jgi:hypothetical protein
VHVADLRDHDRRQDRADTRNRLDREITGSFAGPRVINPVIVSISKSNASTIRHSEFTRARNAGSSGALAGRARLRTPNTSLTGTSAAQYTKSEAPLLHRIKAGKTP